MSVRVGVRVGDGGGKGISGPAQARDDDVRAEAAAAVHASGARLLGLRSRERALEDIYLRYFRDGGVA